MPKKTHYGSTGGFSLGDKVVPDKLTNGKQSIGLRQKKENIPKVYAHKCHHWNIERLKENRMIYRCLNPSCRKKFRAKEI